MKADRFTKGKKIAFFLVVVPRTGCSTSGIHRITVKRVEP